MVAVESARQQDYLEYVIVPAVTAVESARQQDYLEYVVVPCCGSLM